MDPNSKQVASGIRQWKVQRIEANEIRAFEDTIVIEEPLEIRLSYGPSERRHEMPLSITMRTPGNDLALVTGFLITEGIVHSSSDIIEVMQVSENVVNAQLDPEFSFVPGQVQRHFYTTSSCGVCGKASIDMVRQVSPYRLIPGKPTVNFSTLSMMAKHLNEAQPVFMATGGIHAAALFDVKGNLVDIKEDIGRHNAMDKLIGHAAKLGLLPLSEYVVVVSGRGGFELVQKAIAAGVAIFAAVGAPSSLALELADESDMTIAGFVREDRLNVYTHPDRIVSKS